MDRNARTALTVTFIVIGLLLGINYAVAENQDARWLALALFFFGLAGLLWLWRRREEDGDSAELVATESLADVEDHIQQLEERVQEALDEEVKEPVEQPETTPPASAEPAVEVDTASEMPPAEEEELFVDETVGAPEPSAGGQTVEVDPATEVSVEEETFITGDPVPGAEADMVVDETGVLDDIEALNEAEAAEAAGEVEEVVEEPGAVVDTELSETTADEDVEAAATAPVAVPAAEGEAEDLKRIEGIGPYYERLLNEAGVTTFAQLAALSYNDVVRLVVDEQGGRKSASMGTWPEQAALAAAGKWDELAQLQDDLTAGRRS